MWQDGDWKEWIIPAQAVYKSIVTVMTSAFTWFTVWYFSKQPFPSFHGWMFTIMSLHVFSSVAVSSTKTASNLLHMWWPVVRNFFWPAEEFRHTAGGKQSTMQTAAAGMLRRVALVIKQLLRMMLFLLALPLAFAFFLLLHGGAVVADVEVIRRWRVWRTLKGSPGASAAHQAMQEARHHSLEVSVLGHLIYGITCVPVKFALVLLMADFTWIPVTSLLISTAAGISTVAGLCCHPFTSRAALARGIWHRIKGVTLLALALTGHFLCRFLECSWLVFKFSGAASNYYVYIGQLTSLVAFLLLGGPTGHKAFMRCYGSNKVAVTVLLALGSVVMAFDMPALFQGLQDRKTSRQPAWLKQLLFSPAMMALMTWRLVELLVSCILVTVADWVKPCQRPSDIDLIGHLQIQACRDVAWQKVIWLPPCWVCSVYDLLHNTRPMVPLQGIMWGSAAFAVSIAAIGYIGVYVMLKGNLDTGVRANNKTVGGYAAKGVKGRLFGQSRDLNNQAAGTAVPLWKSDEAAADTAQQDVDKLASKTNYPGCHYITQPSPSPATADTSARMTDTAAATAEADAFQSSSNVSEVNATEHHSFFINQPGAGNMRHIVLSFTQLWPVSSVSQSQQTRSPPSASPGAGTPSTTPAPAATAAASASTPAAAALAAPGCRSSAVHRVPVGASDVDEPMSRLLYVELAMGLLLLYAATIVVFSTHLYMKLGVLSAALAYCFAKHGVMVWRGFKSRSRSKQQGLNNAGSVAQGSSSSNSNCDNVATAVVVV